MGAVLYFADIGLRLKKSALFLNMVALICRHDVFTVQSLIEITLQSCIESMLQCNNCTHI